MGQEERFMVMKIGKEHYGIKIHDVKEVVSNTEIIDAPDKESAYICGMIESRYGCVSVCDIYKLFNMKAVSTSKIVIILHFDEKLLAFSTENVDCIVNVSSEKIYDIPSIFNDAAKGYIKNVIVLDNNLVSIIDTVRLFEKVGVLAETELIMQ